MEHEQTARWVAPRSRLRLPHDSSSRSATAAAAAAATATATATATVTVTATPAATSSSPSTTLRFLVMVFALKVRRRILRRFRHFLRRASTRFRLERREPVPSRRQGGRACRALWHVAPDCDGLMLW